ncbi:multicilin [Ictalurus furcatus]|uniref:multicilin n=1 Tax=Ictalurus furcatus TaxID=66913 RepID=UPI00235099F4|nr:multicilin [Ictalurus furcatus]
MDAVDPVQHYLGNAIEMNRQLHVCVQRKQEEISALKERNAQLKELVKEAEIYAAVLDAFTPQPENTSECVSHPASDFTPHSDSYSASTDPSEWDFGAAQEPSWLESLLSHTPPEEEEEWSQRILSEHTNTGVKRQLWPSDVESSSADSPAKCPDKKSRLDQEFLDLSEHHSSEHLGSETVQVFGSFRGLRVLKATPSATSDLRREGRCSVFKTSIREHSTVRTRVFRHGKTFTSHTPDGGCRFLWIPLEQN